MHLYRQHSCSQESTISMKYLLSFAIVFLSTILLAQRDHTIVHGKVTSSPDTIHFSRSYIGCKQYTTNEAWTLFLIYTHDDGSYDHQFPKNTKVELTTSFKDFYPADTTFNTGAGDSITINFIIHPKRYQFTAATAEADLARGVVQLITFDSVLYRWDQKIHFARDLGFDYRLVPTPGDREFESKIDDYNLTVENYLDSLQGDAWQHTAYIITDSLTHLAADNYGKTHKINLKKLTFPASPKLPPAMIERLAEQQKAFNRLIGKKGEKQTDYTPEFMLGKIDSDSNYHFLFVAELCSGAHYITMIPELIRRLTNKKEVGLVNTADLIIWERIHSGDLKFYGHGGIANDDLFTIAGRANHLLRQTTGLDFGSVSMYSTPRDLRKLQNRWAYWLMTLKQ